MKNKHLVLIFLMLVVAVYFSRKQFGKRERSFETALIEVDTTELSTVVFQPPGGQEFSLTKESSGWILSDGERSVIADLAPVSLLLASLARIETRQIAAKNKELWSVYGLDDQQGFRIRLYKGGKLLEDFLLGREDFDPTTQSIISFLRLSGESTIFVVNGLQVTNIGKAFDSYRNRLIMRMKREMEVTDFTWERPDTTLAFTRTDQGWKLGEQTLDSMEVEDYLNEFRNISGEEFADDFDELRAGEYFHSRLSIRGKNIAEPFVLTCYMDSLRKPPFVLQSSQNPRALFSSDSAGVFRKYFLEFENGSY